MKRHLLIMEVVVVMQMKTDFHFTTKMMTMNSTLLELICGISLAMSRNRSENREAVQQV